MNSKAVVVGDLNSLRSFTDDIPTLLVTHKTEAIRSRWCRAWRLLPKGYGAQALLDTLVDVGQASDELPVLFYGDDAALLAISRNREQLRRYFRFLLPPEALVEACADKLKFADLAREMDLPVPRQVSSRNLKSAEDIAGQLAFPVILKPGSHVGWHQFVAARAGDRQVTGAKMLQASNMDEFRVAHEFISRHSPDFVVQEFIHGDEDAIYSFHSYVDSAGTPLTWYVGRKIRTYPAIGGESSYVELVHDDEVARLGCEIVAKLGVVGPVKIDFKKDAISNRLYLLELNLRFNLWNRLGTACGINLPQVAYHDICGLEYPVPRDYKVGVRWLDFYLDAKSFFSHYRPSGSLTLGAWLVSLAGPKVFNIFSWRDPYPFVYLTVSGVIRKLRRVMGLNVP